MNDDRPGRALRTETVEVFSDAVNAWVVRTPGRRFPALVIQGDTLSTIHEEILDVKKSLEDGQLDELREDIKYLEERVRRLLVYYQEVLDRAGCELPYMLRREAPPDEDAGVS